MEQAPNEQRPLRTEKSHLFKSVALPQQEVVVFGDGDELTIKHKQKSEDRPTESQAANHRETLLF